MEKSVQRLWKRMETIIATAHPDTLVAELVRASVEELIETPVEEAKFFLASAGFCVHG